MRECVDVHACMCVCDVVIAARCNEYYCDSLVRTRLVGLWELDCCCLDTSCANGQFFSLLP